MQEPKNMKFIKFLTVIFVKNQVITFYGKMTFLDLQGDGAVSQKNLLYQKEKVDF